MTGLIRASVLSALMSGLLSGLLAASAAAATVQADKACYVNSNPYKGAPMTISGTGFGPGDEIQISGGTAHAVALADATGAFTITTPAPTLAGAKAGVLHSVLTVTDINSTTNAQTTTQLTVTSANLAVTARPSDVRNFRRDRVTWSFSGFTPGEAIYSYYVARGAVAARMRFGVASGPCGTLTQRALLFPDGNPKRSRYKVTFESSPRYSPAAKPRFSARLKIITI